MHLKFVFVCVCMCEEMHSVGPGGFVQEEGFSTATTTTTAHKTD